jgi:hypothetical protein
MRYVTAPLDRLQYKNRGLFWLQSLMDAFQPIKQRQQVLLPFYQRPKTIEYLMSGLEISPGARLRST